ncbi:hypothetical protein P7H17_16715 [Paenibacillus larvae]|nr:hypothetical protein [Paenibacillus larvae]MDT2287350.1 hypothetical protein [Paenibacillus larvae]
MTTASQYFAPGEIKIFEVDKDETFTPKYITWDGQLMAVIAAELETLLDFLLTTAELPPVALGRDNSGTSHTSGAAVKFRMTCCLPRSTVSASTMRKGLRKSYTSRNYWNMRRHRDGLTTSLPYRKSSLRTA